MIAQCRHDVPVTPQASHERLHSTLPYTVGRDLHVYTALMVDDTIGCTRGSTRGLRDCLGSARRALLHAITQSRASLYAPNISEVVRATSAMLKTVTLRQAV
jgi:hypothetical protein